MKLYGSICLSDIPKEAITTGKNGKKYLQINIGERRTPSQWGHTHYVRVYAKQDTLPEGTNLFIGDLKISTYNNDNNADNPQQTETTTSTDQSSGLPF